MTRCASELCYPASKWLTSYRVPFEMSTWTIQLGKQIEVKTTTNSLELKTDDKRNMVI